jgi:hypothetical protein
MTAKYAPSQSQRSAFFVELLPQLAQAYFVLNLPD